MTPESLSEEVLSAYVDGECSDDERVAVEARLATDAQWRAILEEIRATRAVVRALPPREPPAGFVDALIDWPDDTDRAAARDGARSRGRLRVVAGIAAAAAVVFGFVFATPSGRDADVAPPIATLADSHGATVSLQNDPLSGLAPIAANSGFEP